MMDGVIEVSLLAQLFAAAEDASWSALVGLVLLVVVGLVRFITAGLEGRGADWASGVLGLAAGIGAALAAGGLWWHALLLGGLASSSSRGFWELMRGLIRRPRGGAATVGILLLVCVSASGCTTQRAQVGVRTALTSAAEGVAAADRIIAVDVERQSESVLGQIEAECPRPCFNATDRYRSGMARWYEAARGLRASHEALLALDAGVEIWVEAGELPVGWGPACIEAADALEALTASVEAAVGRGAPALLTAAPEALRGACGLVGGDHE